MPQEVRYHMLRPEQIVQRRKASPVAYIPVGNLEWHGVHNPVGADTLQAEGLAVLCAQKAGGLVLPPLYYGENRLEALMEANAGDRDKIAEKMALPTENFDPTNFPYGVMEQTHAYHRLLVHILAEANTLGFELGVLVPGHYPQIDHTRAAVSVYNQWARRRKGTMLAWTFIDYHLVADQYDCAGDHAGGWETSHVMALHPQTVKLGNLPPKGEKLVGAGGRMKPQDSSAEFGRETLEAAAEVAIKEVQDRLKNKGRYVGHGAGLQEGLWR